MYFDSSGKTFLTEVGSKNANVAGLTKPDKLICFGGKTASFVYKEKTIYNWKA